MKTYKVIEPSVSKEQLERDLNNLAHQGYRVVQVVPPKTIANEYEKWEVGPWIILEHLIEPCDGDSLDEVAFMTEAGIKALSLEHIEPELRWLHDEV